MTNTLEQGLYSTSVAGLDTNEILMAIPEPAFIINHEGKIETVNLPFSYLLGYSQHEMVGQSIKQFLPGWHGSETGETGWEQHDGKAHILLAKHSVEENFPVKVSYKQLGEDHHPFLFGSVQDLSIKSYDKARQASLSKCIESAGEAILMTDVDGRIEYVNPSFTRVTGYRKDEIIGKTPKVFKSDRHNKGFYDKMWETIQSGNVWEGQVSNIKKSGEVYEVKLVIAPVSGEMCDIIGYIAIQSDITSLEESKKQLSNTVQKLKKTNQQLESINSMVAHDIKEPLSTIIELLEVLKEEGISEDERSDFTDRAITLSQNLFSFTHDLIEFSSENRKQQPQTKVDLNEVLNIVKLNLSSEIHSKQVVITSDDLPTVNACEGHMISLFQNLIANGIKYQPEGQTPFLDIKTNHDQTSNSLKLSFSDNGIGFDMSKAKDLFSPFKRLDNALKYPGSGVGLSTCKRLINRLSGSITANSELGKGTTFTITLPL